MVPNGQTSSVSTTVGERLSGIPSLAQIARWVVTRRLVQLLVIGAVIDALASHFFQLEAVHYCMMAIMLNFVVLGMCMTRDGLLTRSFDESRRCSVLAYGLQCAFAVFALAAMSGLWIIAATRRPGGEPPAMLAGAVLVLTIVLLLQQFARDWQRDGGESDRNALG